MTKYNFIEQTNKHVEEVAEHEIVQSKIDETLMNMQLGPDSLLALALREVAERAAAVSRAKVLNRDPNLLRTGVEPVEDRPWDAWDPVVIFVNKPNTVIRYLENAIDAMDDGHGDEDDLYSMAMFEKLIESIKEQI